MAKGLLDGILDPLMGNTDGEDASAQAAIEQASEKFAGLSIPEMQKLDPQLFQWVSDFSPTLLEQLPKLTANSITARPDVAYTDVEAAQAKGGADVAADHVSANTSARSIVDNSAMEGVSTDPRLKQAQLAALASMQEIGTSGGLTAADKAQLSRVQGDVAQADRGRREAILQRMSARGMGGSGMELLAQLQSSQGATDRASQAGLDISGMAQQRALQALNQAGGMAGGIRGQDFGEQSQIAAAQDAISKFNAANTQQSNQFNAGVLNNTGQFNAGLGLDAAKFNRSAGDSMSMFNTGQTNNMGQFNAGNTLKTDMANRDYTTGVDQFNATTWNDMAKYNHDNDFRTNAANTGFINDAGMYNNQGNQGVNNNNTVGTNSAEVHNKYKLPTTNWDMKSGKATGEAGALGKLGDFWTSKGDREAQKDAAVIGGAMTVAGAYAGAPPSKPGPDDAEDDINSDEDTKDGIKDLSLDDIMKFLKSVKPKTYKYKPEHAEGDEGTKVGFIMQDIEHTKVGKAISREKNGMKAYDPQSLQGVMLAALKGLAEKKEK